MAASSAFPGFFPPVEITAADLGDETEAELRRDLAAAFRISARLGLNNGIGNHFSLMLPGDELYLLNPRGMLFQELTASSLIVVALAFSSIRSCFRVPGIGNTSTPWCSNQASASCAGVTANALAICMNAAKRCAFVARFGPAKRGLY